MGGGKGRERGEGRRRKRRNGPIHCGEALLPFFSNRWEEGTKKRHERSQECIPIKPTMVVITVFTSLNLKGCSLLVSMCPSCR
jgi:hypothetical protein